MYVIYPLILALTSLFLGCTSAMQKPACGQMDWYEIGRADGAQGKILSVLETHRQSCGDDFDTSVETVYINGRNAGLVEYCSPENGFEMGRMGLSYSYVCPSTMEPQFLSQYEKGKRARALEQENAAYDDQIENIFARIPASESEGETSELHRELNNLRQLRAKNEKELMSISTVTK